MPVLLHFSKSYLFQEHNTSKMPAAILNDAGNLLISARDKYKEPRALFLIDCIQV